MAKLLGEEWGKPPDNFFDPIIDERECIHYRAALNPRTPLTELYRNLSFRMHIHLREVAGGKFGNYCAIFGYNHIASTAVNKIRADIDVRCPPTNCDEFTRTTNRTASSLSRTETSSAKNGNNSYEKDNSMLICVIYGTKHTKRIVINPINSFVRLESLNNCPVFGRDPSKVLLDMASISFWGVEDRELKMPATCIIGRKVAQLVDKQIEHRAGIVGEITNDDTQLIIGRNLLRQSNDDIVWRCWIRLDNKGIGFACDEAINYSLDSIEVLLSPAKLQSWPAEWVHMLYSTYGRQENGDTKDPTEFRDTRPEAQGRVRRTRKGGETDQASSSPPPPEEVKSRTAPYHHHGGYTAKHTHSGSLEDV